MALMGEYEYIIDSTHHRANVDGQVYVHVLNAEKKLKRKLLPSEVVHHIDGNKLNNDEDNLMVFASKSDHTRFHGYNCSEETICINENGSYICRGKINKCCDCGTEISRGSKRCVECYKKDCISSVRPLKLDLYKLLVELNGNFTRAGEILGVTDNAVRKWCRYYDIPSKSREYKSVLN